jgi:2-polyprenyl-3-methyl-5-hydroxy-6-metoxy-1,4-benzoquinol methylase
MSNQSAQPSPELFFRIVNAFQQTEVIKGALEFDLFTAVAEGNRSAAALAERCDASERGMRILCDHLTILGLLTKEDGQYGLTRDSAFFLDRRSPAYIGGTVEFLLSPSMLEAFKNIAAVVRKGGAIFSEEGTVSHENPIWVHFARGMMQLAAFPAQLLAQLIEIDQDRKIKVLDIAASHGLYGLNFAQRSPHVEVVAVDWAPVLEVAKENAQKFGVIDRYRLLPGSAFDVDFGEGYDLVLLTNFLHHFDVKTNERLLAKIHAAMNDGARAVTLEFIPNEDRVAPPAAASFAMTMLVSTPAGDAYPFSELEKMFANAGFQRSELHPLLTPMQQVVISYK